MRKFAIAVAAVAAFTLSACGTTGTTGGFTKDQLNAIIQQIQAATASACAFQPTAASITSLIAAMYPAAAPFTSIVNDVAGAICKAPVTAAAVKRGAVVQTRIVQTPKGPVVVQGAAYRQ